MPAPLQVQFVGGSAGPFRVQRMTTVIGAPLPEVSRVALYEGAGEPPSTSHVWILRGVTSHQRYVERVEGAQLRAAQAGLDRPEATHAAMIPITKSSAWWDMAQDERRAIFEQRSAHIAATLKYLPAIARRLHHGRDLGAAFDFVTWFEFAPEHDELFDELLGVLRASEEWRYVEREVELRLTRE